jgi:hypothetical protein
VVASIVLSSDSLLLMPWSSISSTAISEMAFHTGCPSAGDSHKPQGKKISVLVPLVLAEDLGMSTPILLSLFHHRHWEARS